jgi:hypothetical protein
MEDTLMCEPAEDRFGSRCVGGQGSNNRSIHRLAHREHSRAAVQGEARAVIIILRIPRLVGRRASIAGTAPISTSDFDTAVAVLTALYGACHSRRRHGGRAEHQNNREDSAEQQTHCDLGVPPQPYIMPLMPIVETSFHAATSFALATGVC